MCLLFWHIVSTAEKGVAFILTLNWLLGCVFLGTNLAIVEIYPDFACKIL